MSIMNALGYGGIVAVIGMLIVFFGLTILIACVWLMGKFFQLTEAKKHNNMPL